LGGRGVPELAMSPEEEREGDREEERKMPFIVAT
jgi:hypothetical protein